MWADARLCTRHLAKQTTTGGAQSESVTGNMDTVVAQTVMEARSGSGRGHAIAEMMTVKTERDP